MEKKMKEDQKELYDVVVDYTYALDMLDAG